MHWESIGFKDNPFNTNPIVQHTLDLYTGQSELVKICQNVLLEKNVLMTIEGARGVGTTSFANYLRFFAQTQKNYFTPSNEIRVGANWSPETLLGAIIANTVREIELAQLDSVLNDPRFQNTKALSIRIAETYRSFGINAFGFGLNYGKNAGLSSQPAIVSTSVLGHHIEDLALLLHSAGYKYGLLLQFNNLDIGEIHEEKHLKYLFNELRDYMQTDYVSWLLVGDIGLRKFIAQKVDRVDDIVSHQVEIKALNKLDYTKLIEKRIKFYQNDPNIQFPIDQEVFLYLFDLTEGRLRYIFGLIKRLMHELSVGDLLDKITIDLVKPLVCKFAKERLYKNGLTPGDEEILRALVKNGRASATDLAEELAKSRQYVSRCLVRLCNEKLLEAKSSSRNRIYAPTLDVFIAYNEL